MKLTNLIFIISILLSCVSILGQTFLFKRDRNWWNKSGCIDGTSNVFKKLPITFYGNNEQMLNKIWDDAVADCVNKNKYLGD